MINIFSDEAGSCIGFCPWFRAKTEGIGRWACAICFGQSTVILSKMYFYGDSQLPQCVLRLKLDLAKGFKNRKFERKAIKRTCISIRQR